MQKKITDVTSTTSKGHYQLNGAAGSQRQAGTEAASTETASKPAPTPASEPTKSTFQYILTTCEKLGSKVA